MKDFADYLNESAGQSICWWLQQPSPKPLANLVYMFSEYLEPGDASVEAFLTTGRLTPKLETAWNNYKDKFAKHCPPLSKEIIIAARFLADHFKTDAGVQVSQAAKNSLYKPLKLLLKCSRADWAGYSGVAYRGTVMNKPEIESIKWKGVEKVLGVYSLYGDVVYKSRYDAQSWSSRVEVAKKFSEENLKTVTGYTNRTQFHCILTATLTKHECLFGPVGSEEIVTSVLNMVEKEDEVLRLSNTPKKCIIHTQFSRWLSIMKNTVGGLTDDPEYDSGSMEVFNKTVWREDMKPLFAKYLRKYFASNAAFEAAWKVTLENVRV
jgi:hypothetical protein